MINLNHPDSEALLKVARLIDEAMGLGQKMTVVSSSSRMAILQECAPLLSELRRMNDQAFKGSAYIRKTIDEFETGIRAVSSLGHGKLQAEPIESLEACPHCGTPVARIGYRRPNGQTKVCLECSSLFMQAKEKLESFEGFGTCAI